MNIAPLPLPLQHSLNRFLSPFRMFSRKRVPMFARAPSVGFLPPPKAL